MCLSGDSNDVGYTEDIADDDTSLGVDFVFEPRPDWALVVVERYVRIMQCHRCFDNDSFGFGIYQSICSTCNVGRCDLELPRDHTVGQCRLCGQLGTLDTPHVDCESGRDPMFQSFDPTRCHLYQDFEFADESKLQMEEDFEIKDHIRTRENSHLQDDLLVFYLSQEDVTVDYDIALFLKYVSERIHCMIPFYSDRIRAQQRFLNDYVYPLINIGFHKVEYLLQDLCVLNEELQGHGLVPFNREQIYWIMRLAPLWLNMKSVYNGRMYHPIPRYIIARLPPNSPTIIRATESDENEEDSDSIDNVFIPGPEQQNQNKTDDQALIELNLHIQSASSRRNLWIGDTGASCHMTNSLSGMYNIRSIESSVQVGTGRTIDCRQVGDKRVTVRQKDGTETSVVLQNVKYLPNFFTNLLSITTLLQNGWNISNDGVIITITNGVQSFTMDHIIPTDTGCVVGIEMVPQLESVSPDEMAHLSLSVGSSININKFHSLFGHTCEATTRKTASYYGITLFGAFHPCVSCAISKSRQKNVSKETDVISRLPAERLFIDISSIKEVSNGGSKFWLMVVDHHTDFCWSFFLPRKSELVTKLVHFLRSLLLVPHISTTRTIRCDNAGENIKLQSVLIDNNIAVTFEFTAPGSPQFNGVVERKFQTLYARVRSMLNALDFPRELRSALWAEAANFATEIDNFIVTTTKVKSSWNAFYGGESPYARHVRPFGSLAIVEDYRTRGMRGKLDDRGVLCAYLGPAKDHAADCYRFINFNTRAVIRSRDVTWLHQSYPQVMQHPVFLIDEDEENDVVVPPTTIVAPTAAIPVVAVAPVPVVPVVPPTTPILTTTVDPIPIVPVAPIETNVPIIETVLDDEPSSTLPPTPTGLDSNNPRLERELRRLDADINVPLSSRRTLRSGRDDIAHILFDMTLEEWNAIFHDVNLLTVDYNTIDPTRYKDVFDVPTKYLDAWNHSCPFQRAKWRESITKELTKMNQYKVYKVVKKPSNRQIIKHKWIFDIKRNGVFRARLVACGYSQVPGIDFTDSFSPVITDACFRLLIVIEMIYKLKSKIIDVEVAFLNGDLEEEIYMTLPSGVTGALDECVLLLKSLYGLVQSARQFFKKLREVLLAIGFTQSQADPCLFSKLSDTDKLFLAVYVDDCYVVGTDAALMKLISDLQFHGFKLKVEDKPTDYLSCEIIFNNDKTCAWLGQPHLLKKMEASFSDFVRTSSRYLTPGTPSTSVQRPIQVSDRVSEQDQHIYRSAVGTLLQFVKHSRPDISNSVRELSKCMDYATVAAFEEMKRVLNFVIQTKSFGLKLKPSLLPSNNEWSMTVYTDSDWAGDKTSRRSISGYVIFLMDCPIIWKSKQQVSVTLSSTEAEYVALSEAAKEIKFLYQVLQTLGITVTLPIIVKVDNIGAIFMAENIFEKQTKIMNFLLLLLLVWNASISFVTSQRTTGGATEYTMRVSHHRSLRGHHQTSIH